MQRIQTIRLETDRNLMILGMRFGNERHILKSHKYLVVFDEIWDCMVFKIKQDDITIHDSNKINIRLEFFLS